MKILACTLIIALYALASAKVYLWLLESAGETPTSLYSRIIFSLSFLLAIPGAVQFLPLFLKRRWLAFIISCITAMLVMLVIMLTLVPLEQLIRNALTTKWLSNPLFIVLFGASYNAVVFSLARLVGYDFGSKKQINATN